MKFVVYEIANGAVVTSGGSYNRLRREVEESSPSRWNNLVLLALPDKFPNESIEGLFFKDSPENPVFSSRVVAVPNSGWGYGAEYVGCINSNRRRLGLPGIFTPSREMKDVVEFRKDITSFSDFIQKRPLIGEPESPEGLTESSKLISRLSGVKRKHGKEV